MPVSPLADFGNLNQNWKRAIRELEGPKDIIIKPSDKGDNVVLMDIEKYKNMCTKILRNESWYRCI